MVKLKKTKFKGIFKINGEFATQNLAPGFKVYGEKLIQVKGKEYRVWDKHRSKPAAALTNGLKVFPIKKGQRILYLGIASGTTASHYSDLVGKSGLIFGVEISERPLRDLVKVAEVRGNIVPILADARRPESYEYLVPGKVDLIYQDTADPDQVQIMRRNAQHFLKPEGWALIAIKSQSIDVTKPPKQVYQKCVKQFEKSFEIVDRVELDPYQRAHLFLVMKAKTL